MADPRLSPHFKLSEFTDSQTAARRGIDNTPDAASLRNLKRLARTLEEIRAALGDVPIRISSGYRSPALNRAVGGARNSAHTRGLAVDFTAPAFGSVLATAKAVAKSGVAFDQVIHEYGQWVHLAIPAEDAPPRGELLSIAKGTGYQPGLKNLA